VAGKKPVFGSGKSANSQLFYNFFKIYEKSPVFVEPCGTGYDIIITGYDKYIS
jgi:hypothetical protein